MVSPADGVRAFAPATVGNVVCGFDVLGLALEQPGDEVVARRASTPGVRIRSVEGMGTGIPRDAETNSAGAAVAALLSAKAPDSGVELDLRKGLPLAAGMGGSAASAVAAVVATDALLEIRVSDEELLTFALEGERAAAGQAHGDNAAPCLLGGLVLVRPAGDRRWIRLPVPAGFSVALLRPRMEIPTRDARAAVGDTVPLAAAVEQLGHIAAFVSALHRSDWDLARDALRDRIAEQHRAALIPGFAEVRDAALEAGAMGCGISGAGPSLFALCLDLETAERTGEAMSQAFRPGGDLEADLFVSPVSGRGAHLLEEARP